MKLSMIYKRIFSKKGDGLMKKYVLYLFFIMLVAVSCLPIFQMQGLLYDDAYIHARIARNWIESGFPTFLVGEEFKASSSTGYIIFLYLVGKLTNVLFAIKIYQILAFSLFAYASIKIIAIFDKKNRFLNMLLILSVTPVFLYTVYGGMETSMIIPLLMLSFIYTQENIKIIPLLLIALTVILRIEMLAIFLLMTIFYLIEKKYKDVLIVSTILGIYFVYEILLFGTIIPYAAEVKSIAYGIPYVRSFLAAISINANIYGPHIGLLILYIFLYQFLLFLNQLLTERKINKNRLFSLIFLGASLAILVSWIFGRTLIFPWYLAPLYGLLLIYALNQINLGLTKDKTINILSIILIVSLGNIGSSNFIRNVLMDNSSLRTYEYQKIGDFLYDQCPTCSLVTSEVGALGWSFKGNVFDGFGLGDPKAITFHPLKVPEERSSYAIGAIPPKYIEFRNPDFIVSLPIFIEKFLELDNNSYFKYRCNTPINYSGSNHMLIFSKKEIKELYKIELDCYKF